MVSHQYVFCDVAQDLIFVRNSRYIDYIEMAFHQYAFFVDLKD